PRGQDHDDRLRLHCAYNTASRPQMIPPALRARLAAAPDPDDALRRAERLVPIADEPDVLDVARIACATAPYLAALAARDSERLAAAARDPTLRREKPRALIAAETASAAAGATDGKDLARRLRAHRARELIRLGARE